MNASSTLPLYRVPQFESEIAEVWFAETSSRLLVFSNDSDEAAEFVNRNPVVKPVTISVTTSTVA